MVWEYILRVIDCAHKSLKLLIVWIYRYIQHTLCYFQRLQTIIDSSHLITFGISILVIVYGSFRSLNMDRKSNEGDLSLPVKEKVTLETDGSSCEKIDLLEEENSSSDDSNRSTDDSVQTIDSIQALFIPVVASISLLFMFFFFDSIQTAFVICTSSNYYCLSCLSLLTYLKSVLFFKVLANIAFYYLLTPLFYNILKSLCSKSNLQK